jgi:transposase-like protein
MALWENEHVRSEHSSPKRAGENWLEILRRWIVQCPQCAEVRLVVGANENDQYVCKDCGHSFIITRSIAAKNSFAM